MLGTTTFSSVCALLSNAIWRFETTYKKNTGWEK